MGPFDAATPIEHDEHVVRARRTAACTRVAVGLGGIGLIWAEPHLLEHPVPGLVGFAVIVITSLVQLGRPRPRWLSWEEALSALAGVLIVGLGTQRVGVLGVLWLVAIASGVLARGGRAHWLGRNIVLVALVLPVVREGSLSGEYAALCVGTLGLLLTAGRLTRELNHLLRQARQQADNAEALLLAGDIAARVAERDHDRSPAGLRAHEAASARDALARLIAGEGLTMVVQPIVDLRSGDTHAYEALARFGQPAQAATSPLHWFALAQELGQRPELERACLRQALELLARRPAGTSLSVNLSAPVLLETATLAMLQEAAERLPDELAGLIVEVTEETLVHSDTQLLAAIEPLRARGARLAVDDMGAGYSGLRQITNVRPSYLKLDRSLVSAINLDAERAALVGALVGYCRQVGCALVAEGVESAAELATVERLGVPLVQGYYFSRPEAPWPRVPGGAQRAAVAALGAVADTPSEQQLVPVA